MTDREIMVLAFGDLREVTDGTRRMLEAVPAEHFDWRPHEKSFTLGALTLHVANILFSLRGNLTGDGFDLAADPPPERSGSIPSKEAIMERFEREYRLLIASFDEATPEDLCREWRLRNGDDVLMISTRGEVLRSLGISHLLYHRGQLALYLRLLDCPVPDLFDSGSSEEG